MSQQDSIWNCKPWHCVPGKYTYTNRHLSPCLQQSFSLTSKVYRIRVPTTSSASLSRPQGVSNAIHCGRIRPNKSVISLLLSCVLPKNILMLPYTTTEATSPRVLSELPRNMVWIVVQLKGGWSMSLHLFSGRCISQQGQTA